MVGKGHGDNIHFVDGDLIYSQPDGNAPFWEMTVAGTHPSSLGMERFTSFWTPVLSGVINQTASEWPGMTV